MTKLLAPGWIRPAAPIVIIPHGTAAEVVNAALDFAPLSGVWVCFCGYSHEDYEVTALHVVEAHGEHMHEDLKAFRNNPDSMFRLTPEQMKEIEDERIGAETIAPYISF